MDFQIHPVNLREETTGSIIVYLPRICANREKFWDVLILLSACGTKDVRKVYFMKA